jgi:hypothetical protein
MRTPYTFGYRGSNRTTGDAMFWVVAAVIVLVLAALAWRSSGRKPPARGIDHSKVREVERKSQERGFSA